MFARATTASAGVVFKQLGITSFDVGCGAPGWPGVYAEGRERGSNPPTPPGPIDLPSAVELGQEPPVQAGTHPGLLPLAQPPPSGHPRAVAELPR
jgi:hypothetical protein